MSSSDISLNPLTGNEPETSEEFRSPVGRAAQEEEPSQRQEVNVEGPNK